MEIAGWKYYNHAAIPATAPHEHPDMSPIENGTVWRINGGKPLLARWTTDFDCGYETNWWYVIKDTPFDISLLNAKRRYVVNKGKKCFDVRLIDPDAYKEQLYEVQVAAFSAYPAKYRPTVDREEFLNSLKTWSQFVVFGAFLRQTDELVGYAYVTKQNERFLNLSVLKSDPQFEKLQVNAALVEGVLHHYEGFFAEGGILCDGARSINHETAFQDYLEKYFGFRRAYCKLHIQYHRKVKWIVKLLFPFRNLLKKFDGIGIVHQFNAVMRMEEINRTGEQR